MNLSLLIRKAMQGEPLAEAEKQELLAFAEKWSTSKNGDQFPGLEEQFAQLQESLAQTGAERDAAKAELLSLKRRGSVEALARSAGFEDPGYLEYLLQQRQIDIADENACNNTIAELRKALPKLFNIPLKSGAGSSPVAESNLPVSGAPLELSTLLQQAPEFIS